MTVILLVLGYLVMAYLMACLVSYSEANDFGTPPDVPWLLFVALFWPGFLIGYLLVSIPVPRSLVGWATDMGLRKRAKRLKVRS